MQFGDQILDSGQIWIKKYFQTIKESHKKVQILCLRHKIGGEGVQILKR